MIQKIRKALHKSNEVPDKELISWLTKDCWASLQRPYLFTPVLFRNGFLFEEKAVGDLRSKDRKEAVAGLKLSSRSLPDGTGVTQKHFNSTFFRWTTLSLDSDGSEQKGVIV